MKPGVANALALAAVAGALNALGPKDGLRARDYGIAPIVSVRPPRPPKPAKPRGYYAENGAREVARRKRWIDAGKLNVTAPLR